MKTNKQWKILGFLVLGALALSPGLVYSAASLTKPNGGTFSDKHCEKCQRGADGKMECVQVPCPK